MQQKLVLADRPIRHYTAPSCLFVRHSLHPSLRLFGYLSAYVLSFWQNISLNNLQNSIQFWKCFYLRTENRLKQKKIAENVSLDEWNLSFTILSLKPITSNAQFPICPQIQSRDRPTSQRASRDVSKMIQWHSERSKTTPTRKTERRKAPCIVSTDALTKRKTKTRIRINHPNNGLTDLQLSPTDWMRRFKRTASSGKNQRTPLNSNLILNLAVIARRLWRMRAEQALRHIYGLRAYHIRTN